MTPFQALYGMAPPMITESILMDSSSEEVRDIMQAKFTTFQEIRENHLQAHNRMKIYVDKKRRKRISCGSYGVFEDAALQLHCTRKSQL